MSEPIFPPAAREALRTLYPEQPGLLAHRLLDHPLFELEALAGLAQRLPASSVEYNRGDLPVGIDPEATPSNGLGIAETIRSIKECGSWMVLKLVEQDPAYEHLLHGLLAEIEPLVRSATGEMLKKEAFIFISSPDAVTPFHFDPEHNILLQLRGRKTMTVFPAADESIVAAEAHESFHLGGHRNLPWRADFGDKGRGYELRPGEAIYVPVKAPHWVRNGPEPSISFSITWRSAWSCREADARAFNAVLRKAGYTPSPPARYPRQNLVKAAAYRAARRMNLNH